MHAAIAPDLILTNGRILTTDADNSEAEAIAVKMGRILAVGPSREIMALRGAGTQVLGSGVRGLGDLELLGKLVCKSRPERARGVQSQ
jgi:hypothetical protein